jgi:hypothetical protein
MYAEFHLNVDMQMFKSCATIFGISRALVCETVMCVCPHVRIGLHIGRVQRYLEVYGKQLVH